MTKVIHPEHDKINVPVCLLSDENFLKLTSRPIDVLFALKDRKIGTKPLKRVAEMLGMKLVNLYREKATLRELGFIDAKRDAVNFPLDYEVRGAFCLPTFLVQCQLTPAEWRLILTLYRIAHHKQSAAFQATTSDLCAFSGINEKNLARVRTKLVSRGLVQYTKQTYSLWEPGIGLRVDEWIQPGD
jgi:DNA-binding MarR family transcriptional regulator